VLLALRSPMEGDAEVLCIEGHWGRLSELLRRRNGYQAAAGELISSPWVRGDARSAPSALVPQS
jgi:hypothetical protein